MNNLQNTIHEKDIQLIPDLEVYKEQLERLYNLNKMPYSLDETFKSFISTTVFFPYFISNIAPETINQSRIFRAREKSNFHKYDYCCIRSFSHPGSALSKDNGRANIKDTSIFYGADMAYTALKEIDLSSGKPAFLSVWSINSDRDAKSSIFFPLSIPKENPWTQLAVEQRRSYEQHVKGWNTGKDSQLLYLQDFIANLFVTVSEPYTVTSFIGHTHLFLYQYDLIIYPSLKTDHLQCNIAFHPNFVDRFFRLERVYEVELEEVGGKKYIINVFQMAKLVDANLFWSRNIEEDVVKADFPEHEISIKYC